MIATSLMLFGAFAVLPAPASAHTEADPMVVDLIAGQHTDVGDVLVWNDANNLYVKYMIEDPEDSDDLWALTETHIAVATSYGALPQTKKGNPIPGQFAYSTEHDPAVTEFVYEIPKTWNAGTELYIAAHAVVQNGCLEGIEAWLPTDVTVDLTHAADLVDPTAYFETTVLPVSFLEGTYEGWCIDTHHWVNLDEHTATAYSSYDPMLPDGIMAYPENLPMVNWVINQDFVGIMGPGGAYTWEDVQMAIWQLIEDTWPTDNFQNAGLLVPPNEMNVASIVENATMHDDFVPSCGQELAIVLIPEGFDHEDPGAYQPSIIEFPIPCCYDETAWGNGTQFAGNNWGMYFTYEVQ